MRKENVITIGYYRIPGDTNYTMYLEDTKSYAKEKFNVSPADLDTYISKYKAMYPRHQVCQFIY